MTFQKSINPMKMKFGVEHGPPEEEDDEDDIDVDDPDGGVRLSKRGTLKHEARTLEHLLTHRYKNPYCNSCVRAKMKHHKTYRGAFSSKAHKIRRPHHLRLHGYSQDDQVGL